MKRWFLPEQPDVLGALGEQIRITLEALEAFEEWSNGQLDRAQVVRDREHEADKVRRAVQATLRQAFTTEIGPEDVFELSERLDAVLNGAKNAIREAEVLGLRPDAAMGTMAGHLTGGVRELVAAFAALGRKPGGDEATAAADRAIHEQRAVERVYRAAMSSLLELDDFREVTAKRELYRRYARLGDALEAVADRVWYAVVKQG